MKSKTVTSKCGMTQPEFHDGHNYDEDDDDDDDITWANSQQHLRRNAFESHLANARLWLVTHSREQQKQQLKLNKTWSFWGVAQRTMTAFQEMPPEVCVPTSWLDKTLINLRNESRWSERTAPRFHLQQVNKSQAKILLAKRREKSHRLLLGLSIIIASSKLAAEKMVYFLRTCNRVAVIVTGFLCVCIASLLWGGFHSLRHFCCQGAGTIRNSLFLMPTHI